MLFWLVPEGFSYLILRLEQLKLEKILGFRNMQEKLEKTHSPKTAKSRIERTQMYCEF